MQSAARSVQLAMKRIVDFTVAMVGLIVLSPLLLIIAVAIRLDSPGPVFFRQRRLGKDGSTFRIFKFRTMVDRALQIGTGMVALPDDPRYTRVGRLLRSTSLDELPQVINVVKGDMSLIGPRPTIPAHLEYYGQHERRRLDMLPGVTGWAMVHGRSSNPWSVRIRYDVEYVERFSLWMDMVILLKTIATVFKREHVTYDFAKLGNAFDLTKPGETKEERDRRTDI